jgi:competence protein ComEC
VPRSGWLALGAICAALLAEGTGDPWSAALPAMLAALGAGALRGGMHRRRASARRLLLVAAGASIVAVRLAISAAGAGPVPALPSTPGPFVADVLTIGSRDAGAQRAVLAITDPPGLRLYALLPRYPEIIPGDRIIVGGRVIPPPDDGFGDYLRRSRIAGSITSGTIGRLPSGGGSGAWLEMRRRTAHDLIASVLPEPHAGLASGILIGLRDEVDRQLAAAFTAAGLSHVVAISGWNISIVAAAISAAFGWTSRRLRSAAVLGGIIAYALAAGASASVVRGAIMAAVVIGSRTSGRRSRASATLGVAALLMVVVDPAVAGDAGFQLSAAATAGLIAWGTAMTGWLRDRLPAAVPGAVVETLGVSLAAQATTLAIILVQFGRLSLVAPFANLVAAPLVTPVMAASGLALVAGWTVSLGAPHFVSSLTGAIAAVVLGSLIAVARACAALPFASVELSSGASMLAAATALGATWFLADHDRRGRLARTIVRLHGRMRGRFSLRRHGHPLTARGDLDLLLADPLRAPRSAGRGARARWPAAALAAAVIAGGPALVVFPTTPRLTLTVLDVGQGDAVLIEGPRGSRMLVDGGPDPQRLLAVLDDRVPAWDRRIDLVVVTHSHDDHVAGLPVLVRRYAIGTLVEAGTTGTETGSTADGAAYTALETAATASSVARRSVLAGDVLDLDGAAVRVWWPERAPRTGASAAGQDDANDLSVVVDITFGTRRFLLPGDASDAVDAALVARGIAGAAEHRVDVLKVAHHGSATSTSAPLLAAIRPRVAVISVGADNSYGHPAAVTLDRLTQAGAATWRTDRDGTVAVRTDGDSLEVDSERGADARFAIDGASSQSSKRDTTRPPRIAAWVFLLEPPPQPCFCRSTRRRGSSPTRRSWRRLRRSSPSAPSRRACPWTVPWSRPPPSSTMWTSCCRPIIPSTNWDMARPARAGWRSSATPSFRGPWQRIRSHGSSIPIATAAGMASRHVRNGSSPMPTSADRFAWCRCGLASPVGRSASRSIVRVCSAAGLVPNDSSDRCARWQA